MCRLAMIVLLTVLVTSCDDSPSPVVPSGVMVFSRDCEGYPNPEGAQEGEAYPAL